MTIEPAALLMFCASPLLSAVLSVIVLAVVERMVARQPPG
jgi:hypothetical protein